jgi:TolB-like protein
VATPQRFSTTILAGSLGALALVALAATQGAAARPTGGPQREPQVARVCSPATAPARRLAASLGDVNSIGVAYFAGRSRGGDDGHLAAALTTELATQLLSARPREANSAKRQGRLLVVKLSEGGGFSDVDLSMTGSVFREQNGTVRTEARLTRTSDGSIVWSGSKTRPVLEIPMLARLIAQEVAVRINAQLTAPAPRSPSEKSVEVYEQILRGMYIPSRYDPEQLLQAIDHFNRALELDSTSTRARELRNDAELRLIAWGGTGSPVETRLLRGDALRRIQLRRRDESERLVEEAEGEIRDGASVHACQLLNDAIDRDARSAPGYALRALVRARGGEVRGAFSDAEVVTQLGRPLWGNSLRAVALVRTGDTTAARKQVRRLLAETRRRTGPLPFWDARFLGFALAQLNDWTGVQSVLRRIDPRDPRLDWVRRDPSLQPPNERRSSRRRR